MPPRASIDITLAQMFERLGQIQADVKGVSEGVSALTARVGRLEERQEGSATSTREWLKRLEDDVQRLDGDFRDFKDKQAERERTNALETGVERGTNKTNWKVVAAIGAVALALLGDLLFHGITALGAAPKEAPALNYTPTEPSKLHVGEHGGTGEK